MASEVTALLEEAGYDLATRKAVESRYVSRTMTPDDELAFSVIMSVGQFVFAKHNVVLAIDE